MLDFDVLRRAGLGRDILDRMGGGKSLFECGCDGFNGHFPVTMELDQYHRIRKGDDHFF